MKSLKNCISGELKWNKWIMIKEDWWLKSINDENQLMIKVNWWLKLIDDSLLKYHYRHMNEQTNGWMNGWMGNAKSRVTFATENITYKDIVTDP